ncbi:hypothetical protein AV540_16430 [Brevibacillus parabrevis]|uniref:hypothetical protein n=1 Tax=Brevibacillus parabrevis TaxID=54914 RepID=UPI0007AB38B5|nr:hypothetical protein [Brevibacillus parabrevis]KZE48847.1 hypothetical protein AV540_16430 [Brevibacillus parabrevis]
MDKLYGGQRMLRGALHNALWMWENATIMIADIRHRLLRPDESIRHYQMLANMFMFAERSQVYLDDAQYQTERFGVFHEGKGTLLSIPPKYL